MDLILILRKYPFKQEKQCLRRVWRSTRMRRRRKKMFIRRKHLLHLSFSENLPENLRGRLFERHLAIIQIKNLYKLALTLVHTHITFIHLQNLKLLMTPRKREESLRDKACINISNSRNWATRFIYLRQPSPLIWWQLTMMTLGCHLW